MLSVTLPALSETGNMPLMFKMKSLPTWLHIILLLTGLTMASGTAANQQQLPGPDGNPVMALSENWQLYINGDDKSTVQNLPLNLGIEAEYVQLINKFVIPDSLKDLDIVLHFAGIRGFAGISLNKTLIRTHPDVLTPFSVTVQKEWLRKSGENILELRISQPDHFPDKIPEFGYLYREKSGLSIPALVYVEWLPLVRYSDFDYKFDQALQIHYELNIGFSDTLRGGNFKKLRFEEILLDSDGTKVFTRFEYIDFRSQRKAVSREIRLNNPRLWSPGSPELYTIELKAYSDGQLVAQMTHPLGLRNVSVTADEFSLNGSPFPVRGITYRIPQYVSANDNFRLMDLIKADLENIKSLGFNAIRIPNSTLPPYALYQADSLGLMIFSEIGVWRVPPVYFTNDDFMEMLKSVTSEMTESSRLHPSVIALGLGSEILLKDPGVQKVILILDKQVKNASNLLTYAAPTDYTKLPLTHLTDFFILNTYDQAVFSALDYFKSYNSPLSAGFMLGNVGFAAGRDSVRTQFLNFLTDFKATEHLCGYFIESYRDWHKAVPTLNPITGNTYTYGLYEINGTPREMVEFYANYFSSEALPAAAYIPTSSEKTNFFSLSIFLSSILFFMFYRQYFNFRDNVKRSLSHSYGFFVDLRDRRIIALLNSFIIGMFSNLLVANILSAYIYFYRNDPYMEEIISAILVPFGLKGFYLSIVQSAFLLLLVIWILFFIGQIFIAAILRFFSMFVEERVRYRQTVAVCNWAGVPLLFLIPVSLIAYQLILPRENLHIYLLIILIIFFFWYNYRLANGIRVLMIMNTLKVFSILVLTYCVLFFTFFAFLESRSEFSEYFNLLTQARRLFY